MFVINPLKESNLILKSDIYEKVCMDDCYVHYTDNSLWC